MKLVLGAYILFFSAIVSAADMTIDSNGNIGVGTEIPTSKLDVLTSSGDAVIGEADNGVGIYGISNTGFAGYFQGNTKVTGNLTVDGTVTGTGVGDITGISSGTGLTGGGTSGDITLNVDTAIIQRRVSSLCTAGSSIRAINEDGTVVCETDNDSGGDITAVNTNGGLTGGGTSGDLNLNVDFSGTGSATTVSRSDHDHNNVYQQKYSGVAVVARNGGDYNDPYSAMNDVATWCGTPSATNPCLLKIMPGVYDIASNSLQMQDYVDIEGSGENATKITGNTSSLNGLVNGADNAEIRFITLENTGGGYYAFAIEMNNTSPKITNVTAIASGGTENAAILCEATSQGIPSATMLNVTATASGGIVAIGVYIDYYVYPTITNLKATATNATENLGFDLNNYASPKMTNITAIASGGTRNHALHINGGSSPVISNITATASGATDDNYAVYNIHSSPEIINLKADASGGTNNYAIYNKNFNSTGGTIKIDHSVIKGTTNAVYTDSTYTTLIGNTRIGGSVTGPGTNRCAGVYDENYNNFYSNTCP